VDSQHSTTDEREKLMIEQSQNSES